jgi:hypothetical protein
MSEITTLKLKRIDISQILDALNIRAIAWEKTAALLNGDDPSEIGKIESAFIERDALDDLFIPEECSDPYEAEQIAKHHRHIITEIERQFYADR